MDESIITCSCTTTHMGLPAGRLVWEGDDETSLKTGKYGQRTLDYSLYVEGIDNGRPFPCRLEWTNDQSKWKSDTAILDVLYKPSLVISGYTQGRVLYEGDQHRVNCSAQGGNPLVSHITLTCQNQTGQEDQRHTTDIALLQFTVKRDNPHCTCSAHAPDHQGWDSVSSTVQLTVRYPPSNPRIQGFKNAYRQGDSARLTCNSEDEGSPPASYQWLENNRITTRGTSFTKRRLQRTDAGRKIGCRAVNDFTKVKYLNLTTERTLVIHYPPSHRPSISGYTSDQVLYMGDERTVTCSAEGGNPAVFRITLTCQNRSTVAYSTYLAKTITPRLTFNVSAGNPWCTCTAHPPTDAKWDAVTSHENLTIYTPPSPPQITRLHRGQSAYKENEEAVLTCESGIVGNPAVSYVWSYQGRDNVSPYGNRLIVRSLTWQDNGLEIGCRARNNFTDTKGLNLITVFMLEVFYRPQISFQSLAGSDCVDAASGECNVDEGQRIRMGCLAHSNPGIKKISWEKNFQIPVLDITASRSQDDSEFICEAATETNTTAGLRNPLKNSKSLRIRVQYLPDRPVLTLKSSGLNVTNWSVKENDPVNLTCVGKARPKPSVQLMKAGQPLRSTELSSAGDGGVWMSHSIELARCEDSGSPRLADSMALPHRNITYRGIPEQLTFDLVAYPLPNATVAYYDHLYANGFNPQTTVSKDKFNSTCEKTDVISHVRCSIWIQNVTSGDEGSYQLTVQNSEGPLDAITFQLSMEKEVPSIADDRLWLNTSHIIGITVGAVCGIATIIAIVVFVIRARWKAYERPPPARRWEMHEYGALSPKPAPPRPSSVATDIADANPYDVIPADDGDYSEPITGDDYLHPAALTPERTTDQTDADPHPATLDTARASCNYDDCFNVVTSTEDNVDQAEGTHHPVHEQASPEYSNIPHDEGKDLEPYSNVP
ncbi:hypothetical protein BaRGS_00008890 [Batillaria attramentaria]|uniref:Ig-like domain-containing protein n=1 Tax=Batillaria attramentaria TaxID=370345 RepID=A0ABD0LJU2_9CAEN